MRFLRHILLSSASLLLALATPVSARMLWTEGHGDIGFGYEDGVVEPHWHIEGGTVDGTPRPDEEFASDALRLIVPNVPAAKSTRNSDPSWAPIGVAAGETFWRLPSGATAGVPYLGWSTEELDESDWEGDLTFTLSGLTAPGDIALYYFPDGEKTFLWASYDGLSAADAFIMEAGVHEHFNMSFTAPGLYEVQITMFGTHKGDGFVSRTETFEFNVVPEPSTFLLFGAGAIFLVLRRFRRK